MSFVSFAAWRVAALPSLRSRAIPLADSSSSCIVSIPLGLLPSLSSLSPIVSKKTQNPHVLRASMASWTGSMRNMQAYDLEENENLRNTAYSKTSVPTSSIGSLRRFDRRMPLSSTISNMIKVTVIGRNDRARREGQMYLLYQELLEVSQKRSCMFIERYKIEDTFKTWFLTTVLHLWMIIVRLRAVKFPDKTEDECSEIAQKYILLLSSFFLKDAEERLRDFGFSTGNFSKAVRLYFGYFHGNIYSYDEAVFHSDGLFAAVLWRNIFNGKEVDTRVLVDLVTMVRRDLQALEKLSADDLLMANFSFPDYHLENKSTTE